MSCNVKYFMWYAVIYPVDAVSLSYSTLSFYSVDQIRIGKLYCLEGALYYYP